MLTCGALLLALYVLLRYGIGERYNGYVVNKRGNVWTVHHTPSFVFFYHNLHSFLTMRERSFQLIAADLPDDAIVLEESIWLDGHRDGAGWVKRRKASWLDFLLAKQLYVQNVYNWIPHKSKPKRAKRSDIMSNYWTAQEFRSRFTPVKRKVLLDDQGAAGSIYFYMFFTHPFGLVLIFIAMQMTNNMALYDALYTAADASTLAGAMQQQTAVIQYSNGYPALWTQTINDDSATLQAINLFRFNLFAEFSPDYIAQHMYFNGSTNPGYTDSAVTANLNFTTYNYQGIPYQVGTTLDIPVAFDTTLMNEAMSFLKNGSWSNQIHFVVHSRSSFTFFLYDSTHTKGYKP